MGMGRMGRRLLAGRHGDTAAHLADNTGDDSEPAWYGHFRERKSGGQVTVAAVGHAFNACRLATCSMIRLPICNGSAGP